MLARLLYKHDHECEFENEVVEVRPTVDKGAYPSVDIRCVETHKSLAIIKRETI